MKGLRYFGKLAAASVLTLSISTFSLPTLSHQNDGDGTQAHMGMMGQMPMMGGGHMGMMGQMPMMGGGHMGMMHRYKGLGLSDEQKQQMNDSQHKLRKKHWEIMGQMIDQQAALRKAYANHRPDPKAVGAVYGQIFDLKRQVIEAALDAKNSIKDVLTEEQLAQLKKMRHQGGGMMQGQGGMMQGQGGMMQGQGGMMQDQDCPPQTN